MPESPIGRTGRVTGRIRPGEIGEASIPVGGGTAYFHAYAYLPGTTFESGEQVVVMEFAPPQTVYVSEAVPREPS